MKRQSSADFQSSQRSPDNARVQGCLYSRDPMYERHFALRTEPFSLTPDPSFLYLSPEHAEAMAAIEVGLRGRRGLMVMTGEVGTGKTTLLYELLTRLGSEVRTAYISNTKLSFDHMLQQALTDFGIPCPGPDRLDRLTALNTFLRQCATEGATAALVIDEAQNLDGEAFEHLRLLSNFETFTSKLLQVVLVGQPELRLKLRHPSLHQVAERVAVHCHLKPLSRAESRKYVQHRLECAGGSLALFSPAALRLLLRRAHGVPRRINIICHNALLFAYGADAERVARSHVRAAVREREGLRMVRTAPQDHRIKIWQTTGFRPWLIAAGTLLATLGALMLSWTSRGLWEWLIAPLVESARVASVGEDAPTRAQRGDASAVSAADSAAAQVVADRGAPGDQPVSDDRSAPLTSDVAATFPSKAVHTAGDGAADRRGATLTSVGNAQPGDGRAPVAAPAPPADAAPIPRGNHPTHIESRSERADAAEFRTVRVGRGSTLGSLTRQFYGAVNPQLLNRVQSANPQIIDMNRIVAGDRLRFPVAAPQDGPVGPE